MIADMNISVCAVFWTTLGRRRTLSTLQARIKVRPFRSGKDTLDHVFLVFLFYYLLLWKRQLTNKWTVAQRPREMLTFGINVVSDGFRCNQVFRISSIEVVFQLRWQPIVVNVKSIDFRM